MLTPEALAVANKITQAVFGADNPYTLSELKEKFAFDIDLPIEVKDSTTGEKTYTSVPNVETYVTEPNSWKRENWMLPRQDVHSLQQILEIWQSINSTVTERVYHSENVHASDPIYDSSNVYGSTNCGHGQNLIYCDGCYDCSCALACCRSSNVNFCIRADDSATCTNSYNVICSNHITNSMFIQDANTLHECIFCSHIENHEYCIANMQFEKDEYFYLKSQIVKWILQ